jgi:hypothetical protein
MELLNYAKHESGEDIRGLLSTEYQNVALSGSTGALQRIGITTMDGLRQAPSGFVGAVEHSLANPTEALKTLGESALFAAGLKLVLPEAGPVARLAGLALGAKFVADSAPAFVEAYQTGLNAQTWQEMHQAGRTWGNAAGQLGLSAGIGLVGYKLGAGAAGDLLASPRAAKFNEFKQNFWDGKSANIIPPNLVDASRYVSGRSELVPQPQSSMFQMYQEQLAGTAVITKVPEEIAPLVDGKVQVSTFKTITEDTPPKPSSMDFTYEIQPQKLNYDADGPTGQMWNFAKDRVFPLEWFDEKTSKKVHGTAFPVETVIDGKTIKSLISAHHNVARSMGGTVGVFRVKLPDGSSAPVRLTRIDSGADISALDFANPADWDRVKTIPLGWASELRNDKSVDPTAVYVFGYPQDAAGLRLTHGLVRNIYTNNFGACYPETGSGYLDVREQVARISSSMPNYPGLSGGPLLYKADDVTFKVGGVHTAGVIKLADGYSTAVEHVRAMLVSAEMPPPKPNMAQQVFSQASEVSDTVGYDSKTGNYDFAVRPFYLPVSLDAPISRVTSAK